jgi:hypothetical protein
MQGECYNTRSDTMSRALIDGPMNCGIFPTPDPLTEATWDLEADTRKLSAAGPFAMSA